MTAISSLRILTHLRAGRPQTIVLYGTSLTHGGAWATALREWFDMKFPGLVTVVNSGGPGENSDWGLANVQAKVAGHKPDLVLIEFAVNDAHERFETITPERAWQNLDGIVSTIRGANTQAEVVLQIMNEPWDAPNDKRCHSARPLLARYNENYRRYAAQHALPLLDHALEWQRVRESNRKQFEEWMPDGIHPTAEGSLAVTWPTLRSFFENGDTLS